jgi:predicted MFS family arabinose efflux permease
MNRTLPQSSSQKWFVFAAVAFAYFFVNFATFASLGVVLFTMAGELHWSMTAAGFTFSLLGLACGLSSTLPTIAMKYLGTRGSMAIGAALFFFGCLLASMSHSLLVFDIAIAMLGAGYTFAGNIPGVILIAQWFDRGSARLVGIYLMVGALGAAAAPPAVAFVVRGIGWRGHWQVLAVAAAIVGLTCLAFVRDNEHDTAATPDEAGNRPAQPKTAWTQQQAVRTSQFIVLTAALVLTMTAVTTINGVVVTHLVKLGSSPITAAWALGLLSFTGTLMKGGAGHLCETKSPKAFVVAGLLCQAVGCALLIVATSAVVEFAAAIVFGAGWAFAFVGGWVLLMRYFGGATGARLLAIVQLVTTVGAAGPIGAGLIADRWGTFTPIFLLYAVALALLAVPALLMRAPAARGGAKVPDYGTHAVAEPA